MKLKLPNWGSLCNPNLLLNSDFKSGIINQQGKTSYIGTSSYTYTIDMWRQIGYIKTSVFSNYIRLETLPDNTQPVYFEQVLSKEVNEDCILAIKVKNVSGDVVVAIKGTTNKGLNITNAGVFTIQNANAESVFVQLKGTTSYVEIEFIKLEKGKYFTGMTYWDRTLELLKCYRRMVVIDKNMVNDAQFFFFGTSSARYNVVVMYIPLPTKLYKTPSLKGAYTIKFRHYTNAEYWSAVSKVELGSVTSSEITLLLTTTIARNIVGECWVEGQLIIDSNEY